ncbi:hypothetical protein VTO42DRAFT_5099 [Malbranchea cinnamomea]
MTSSSSATKPASQPANPHKPKYRAKQSCIPCRTRKVKCDRIKPCQACCVRGLPSECEYVTTNEDRFLISQADAIENLRNEVGRLKQRLADLTAAQETPQPPPPPPRPAPSPPGTPGSVPYEKYAALQSILHAIASGSPEVVASTVAQVRSGAPLENVADLVKHLSSEDPAWGQPGSGEPPSIYAAPSPRGYQDYSQIKRVKQEEPSEYDQTLNDFSPVAFSQNYDLAFRSRPFQSWGGGDDWNGRPDYSYYYQDAVGAHGPATLIPSQGYPNSRKRPRSPAPLPPRISGRSATMEVFLARFVDAFSPKFERGWGSSTTLRSAAEIRMFSPILCDALEAVSVTYFGQSMNDRQLEAAAYDTYLSVLRNLQHALYNAEQSKSQAILLTVTVLMAFECIQRTTSGSIVNHSLGCLKLIDHRGPHRHMYGVEHMFFTEFRPYLASIALVVRAPTFLAREEWKLVPWSAGSSVKDSLQHLLDVVVDIPAFLHQFDRFNQGLNNGTIPCSEVSATQTMLWTWVADLDRRLRKWKEDYIDSDPNGPAREGDIPGDAQFPFPVFQCRDLDTMEVITPKPLVYSDLRHAQTMCIYESALLVLGAADTRPVGAMSPREQYTAACNICRSMEFYIRTIPGGLINRLAFPLRTAYDALPEGNVERKFVEEVFRLVEQRFKLRLWGSMIPEIATTRKHLTT